MKERLLKFSTYNHKVENSKYSEYWVPVELSTVQLEQYCANLISHSLSLRSLSKTDHVGALSDALTSQHKVSWLISPCVFSVDNWPIWCCLFS